MIFNAITWLYWLSGTAIFIWWALTAFEHLPKWLSPLDKLPPVPSWVIWGFVALDVAWLAFKYWRNRRLQETRR
jgi:hypothetical protein